MRSALVLTLLKAYWVGNKPVRTALERLSFVRRDSRKGKVAHALMILLLLAVFVYFLLFLGMNYYAYQTLGYLLDLPHLGLFMACLVSFLSLFLLSFTSVTSLVYESKDIALLRPLCLEGGEVAVSRLLLVYAYHLPLHLFLFFPALVVALFGNGFSVVYLLGSLALLFAFPLFPLALSTLLAMGLALVAKHRRTSLFQQVIPMILFFVLIIMASTTMTRFMVDESVFSVDYQAMQASLGTLFSRMESQLALFSLAARVTSNVSMLLLFLLSAALISLAVGSLAAKSYDSLYYAIASGSSTHTKKRRNAIVGARGPLVALMRRELIIIRSHSAFIFEVVGEMFIPLVLLIVYALTGVLDELSKAMINVRSFVFLPELLFLVLLMMASLGMLSSTSVSRQGKMFNLDRLYPLQAKHFVQAKLSLHLLLFGLPNLIYLIISLLALQLSLFHLGWMAPLSLLSLAVISTLHLALDYHHPNLAWTTAQQAMKSNLNGLLGMLIALAWVVVVAALLLLPHFLPIPSLLGWVLLALIGPLALLCSYRLAVGEASLALTR
ncbi:hypothetical protein SDC9_78239 [bioreactor metagenome]|uniref:Uncharacterized protein n=1 Tax=bioreactor metagenome TaxID=1076179 RepID=A0A644YSY5_9ZZZZ|nr:hypothetical protein [Sphaerochaeta sp.]